MRIDIIVVLAVRQTGLHEEIAFLLWLTVLLLEFGSHRVLVILAYGELAL